MNNCPHDVLFMADNELIKIDSDTISRKALIEAFWKLDVELKPSAINALLSMFNTLPPKEVKTKS